MSTSETTAPVAPTRGRLRVRRVATGHLIVAGVLVLEAAWIALIALLVYELSRSPWW